MSDEHKPVVHQEQPSAETAPKPSSEEQKKSPSDATE
jgi:hypothetical protein